MSNEYIKEEWSDLGFYYELDDEVKSWIFKGSRAGLMKLCDILDAYTRNSKMHQLTEHDHYGPYMHLKIMTLDKRDISNDHIAGTIQDLVNLRVLIHSFLMTCKEGDEYLIHDDYSANSAYKIKLIVMEDEFDPSSADPKIN